jgi:membrane-bound lytic murein transglycosylase B
VALPAPSPLADAPGLAEFAAQLSRDEGWPAEELSALLTQAQRLPSVRRLILPAPAGAAKNWAAYRQRFIEPKRVQAGAAFWAEHAAALERAQSQYGVPAAVIVGIIGVETFYGRHMGGFSTLDALATLAFDFPAEHPRAEARQAFFRSELAEFLRLTRAEGLDPREVKGSYAGALGWPQFMPGSWRRYAVDFDGDGRIDLSHSPVDAIGSVAHFLAEHGWQPGQTTHYTLRLPPPGAERDRLLAPDIHPSFSPAELTAAGAKLSEAARSHAGPLAVVELQNGKHAAQHLLGTQNFYTITRYNWSAYYAMAVIELGQAVQRHRQAR